MPTEPDSVQELFQEVQRFLSLHDDLPPPDTRLGQMTRELFSNMWDECCDDLLSRTNRIRVMPEPHPAPRIFNFEMDLPYKRKIGEQPVELMPGPIRGLVIYRPDLLSNMHEQSVAVRLDPTMNYLHPNFSRQHGLLCLGDLPPGPFPLAALLEHHLFPILSYQNRRPVHPADVEAARYFAMDPQCMDGLTEVEHLY